MANTVYIKDFYGKICGKIEEEPNGDRIAKDFYGRYLGKYKASTGKTHDFYGRILATGDITASLVRDADRENKNK